MLRVNVGHVQVKQKSLLCLRFHHLIAFLTTPLILNTSSDLCSSIIHITILFLQLTILLQHTLHSSAIFLLIALPIDLCKGLQPLQVCQKHVLSNLCIELDQGQELEFQLIENFYVDSSYAGIEGIFIVKIIEVLSRDYICSQHDPMHIFFMKDEERIVLLHPVDQHQRIDEDTNGRIHVFEHSQLTMDVLERQSAMEMVGAAFKLKMEVE